MLIMDEFIAVTGASEERAKFFLEAAGGNLQVCMLLVVASCACNFALITVSAERFLRGG